MINYVTSLKVLSAAEKRGKIEQDTGSAVSVHVDGCVCTSFE